MTHLRYVPGSWGNFNAERYGLIGHDSCDVMTWLNAHPEFTGSIWFDYGDDGGEVEVTDLFVAESAAGFVGSTRITQEQAA